MARRGTLFRVGECMGTDHEVASPKKIQEIGGCGEVGGAGEGVE